MDAQQAQHDSTADASMPAQPSAHKGHAADVINAANIQPDPTYAMFNDCESAANSIVKHSGDATVSFRLSDDSYAIGSYSKAFSNSLSSMQKALTSDAHAEARGRHAGSSPKASSSPNASSSPDAHNGGGVEGSSKGALPSHAAVTLDTVVTAEQDRLSVGQQATAFSHQSELTATKTSLTDTAGHAMVPAMPCSTTAVGISMPEGSQQLGTQAQLGSLVGSAFCASTSALAHTLASVMLADPSTAADAQGSMQAPATTTKPGSASPHHHGGTSMSPTAAGAGPRSLVSALRPTSELLSHEATQNLLQNANSSSSGNSSPEGKPLGYADVMQLTLSPQAVAQPPHDISAARVPATSSTQIQTAEMLCVEPSLKAWDGLVNCAPRPAEPEQPLGVASKHTSCSASTVEPEPAGSEAGVTVDHNSQAMHLNIANVPTPNSVQKGGSCMYVEQALGIGAPCESGWVDVELFPSDSGMLQGSDDAATALTDSPGTSRRGYTTPCGTEAAFAAENGRSTAVFDETAVWSEKVAFHDLQAKKLIPVSASASTSANRYLSLVHPAFWRQESASSSKIAAAQKASSSADAPLLSQVSQYLQQLTDAARPSVAEATAAAAAKAAELKATASAMTADLSAQAAERAARLRSKLGVRLSSRQPSAATKVGQGGFGTGAGSTRLGVLQHTAGKQLGEEGAPPGAKHEYSLQPQDDSDSIQAQHRCVTLPADCQEPVKGMQKGKDGGHIAMPLPRQLVEGPVTSTIAEQDEIVQVLAAARLSPKYALADVLGFDAASVDRAEAAASMVASWWSGNKPKQGL